MKTKKQVFAEYCLEPRDLEGKKINHNKKMWHFSQEQIIQLMNRINDVWEINTDISDHLEFVAATQRLLGSLNMLLNPENFY